MPLGEWPTKDRESWLSSIRTADILDDGGARAGLRAVSNRKMELGFGRYQTFLERNDLPMNESALEQVNKPSVLRYVSELRELGNSSGTILGRLQELHDVVCAMGPERDWNWIRSVSSSVRSAHAHGIEKRQKMVGTDDLFSLGEHLMKSAFRSRTARTAAIDYRDGLIIALLALRPLRLRNLATLELGRTLLRDNDSFRIAFEGSEMKNGVSLEFEWPGVLTAPLQEWLGRYRPALARLRSRWAREIGNALWVSSHGSPMTKQAIYDRITDRTREEFGTAINPHLFRDIAATTQAIMDPKHVGITAPLLGHATFSTTERYYLQARLIEASARYQGRISALRRRLTRTKT